MVYSSMEVGVCAEAYQGGEPLRHINSAFMTFEVLDCDRKPKTLPRIRPEPVVSFTAWNPTIYSIRFSHKKKEAHFQHQNLHPFVRISAWGFLVFYRMEKDVIKKLSPERRFALIGWDLSLNHHFVLCVAYRYIRGPTCFIADSMYAVVSVKVYAYAKNMQYFLCPERTVCLQPEVALRQHLSSCLPVPI